MSLLAAPQPQLHLRQFFTCLSRLPSAQQCTDSYKVAFINKEENSQRFSLTTFSSEDDFDLAKAKTNILSQSQLTTFNLFSGYPNDDLEANYVLRDNNKYYFVRPFSLFLSPIAILIVPCHEFHSWENDLRTHFEEVNYTLWNFVEAMIEQDLNLQRLASYSSEEFTQQLTHAMAKAILPYSWQTASGQFHEFATELFTYHVNNPLKLSLADGSALTYFLPNIMQHIDWESFGWEYSENLLSHKKRYLLSRVDRLIERLTQNQQILRETSLKQGHLPEITKKMDEIVHNVTQLSNQLNKVERDIHKWQSSRGVVSEKFCFYPLDERSFRIVFDGEEIGGLGTIQSKYLHILLSNPGYSFSAISLKAASKTMSIDEQQNEEDQKDLLKLTEYIKKELDSNKAFEQLPYHIRQTKIDAGIKVFENAVKRFPKAELEDYLNYYLALKKQYLSSSEEGFAKDLTQNWPSLSETEAKTAGSVKRQIQKVRKIYPEKHPFTVFLKETILVRNGTFAYRPDQYADDAIDWKLQA